MLNTSKDINITVSAKGSAAVIGIAFALSALSASAQTAKDIKGATVPHEFLSHLKPDSLIGSGDQGNAFALHRYLLLGSAPEILHILKIGDKARPRRVPSQVFPCLSTRSGHVEPGEHR